MNLGDMRRQVRVRSNVSATDDVWSAQFVNSAVNEALTQISLEQPWWWLQATETTTATDGLVDLSAVTPVIRDITAVFVGADEAKKVSVTETDATSLVGPEDARFVFSVWGDTLQLRPSPADTETITIRYYQDEPILSADSGEPLMPEVYHPCVVEKACAICFESVGEAPAAAMHEARSRALVSHMVATALRRLRGRHSVRVRHGYPY